MLTDFVRTVYSLQGIRESDHLSFKNDILLDARNCTRDRRRRRLWKAQGFSNDPIRFSARILLMTEPHHIRVYPEAIERRVPLTFTEDSDTRIPRFVDLDVYLCALAVVLGLYPDVLGTTEGRQGVLAAAPFHALRDLSS